MVALNPEFHLLPGSWAGMEGLMQRDEGEEDRPTKEAGFYLRVGKATGGHTPDTQDQMGGFP